MVPVEALLEADGGEATVFTLAAGGRAVRRRVSVGALQDGRVAVEGLDGERLVVTDGAAYLDDGDSVEVKR
jgi:multidrug efflux pump subunit AcrA (membrane-fusion protein)